MACGKKQQPSYQPPKPPTLPTAAQLFQNAIGFAKTNTPLAYGAREGALADLNRGQDYYAGFQPTSFEQALANQYFQNVFPDTEKSIRNSLSLSGMAYSPTLARLTGKARGDIGVDIGSFLSNQGNERARYSLAQRLAIDPSSTYGNYLDTDVNQSNNQANLDYNYAQQQAQQDYQNALQKYQQQQALYRTIGSISPLGGAIYGGASGGSGGFSSSLGGTLSTAQAALPFLTAGGGGGAEAAGVAGGGLNFGDALFSGNWFRNRTTQPVYDGTNTMDFLQKNALY